MRPVRPSEAPCSRFTSGSAARGSSAGGIGAAVAEAREAANGGRAVDNATHSRHRARAGLDAALALLEDALSSGDDDPRVRAAATRVAVAAAGPAVPAPVALARTGADLHEALLDWQAEYLAPRAREAASFAVEERRIVRPDVEANAQLMRRAIAAVNRAAALTSATRIAVARATWLVVTTLPLMEHCTASHNDVSQALRALSELENSGRTVGRLADAISSALDVLDPPHAIPVPSAADERERRSLGDVHDTVRSTVRAAALAEETRTCLFAAAEALDATAGAAPPSFAASDVAVWPASARVRWAYRNADELAIHTATAGRQLSEAVGWEKELPILLSEEQASVAMAV